MTYLPKTRGPEVVTELDRVPWEERQHAYGRGSGPFHGTRWDVQAALTTAFSRGADEEGRADAHAVLFGALFHQDTTYEATCDAVPFVVAYLADIEDDAWSKELWLWLGNVLLSAMLPPAESASHGGAWGPGVRLTLLGAIRDSLASMGAREGSRFSSFADALRVAARSDEPADAERESIVTGALKELFHLAV